MKFKSYVKMILTVAVFFCAFQLYSTDSLKRDGKPAQQNEDVSKVVNVPEPQPVPPPTEKAKPEVPKIIIPVILDAYERIEIFPEVFEEVESVPFKLGQHFKKGDLLIRMKNFAYKSQVDKALAGVDYAVEDLRVKESLRQSNLISLLDLMQAKFNLATAITQRDEALRNYQATVIFAPFDGRVGALRIREYERPSRQKSMMEIFNDRKIIARMIIPSSLLPQFGIGQKIRIVIRDLNETVTARVTRVGAEINPVSGTINVEAEIDNLDGRLIPGMVSFVTVEPMNDERSNP
jgi:RND family efflux transporter MFP subunit